MAVLALSVGGNQLELMSILCRHVSDSYIIVFIDGHLYRPVSGSYIIDFTIIVLLISYKVDTGSPAV